MLRGLWHFLFGHSWRERDVVFNQPAAKIFFPWSKHEKEGHYGFTDITLVCECGALKVHRLIGKHCTAGDAEALELRKLCGL